MACLGCPILVEVPCLPVDGVVRQGEGHVLCRALLTCRMADGDQIFSRKRRDAGDGQHPDRYDGPQEASFLFGH